MSDQEETNTEPTTEPEVTEVADEKEEKAEDVIDHDAEIEMMKKRVAEMEAEAAKIEELDPGNGAVAEEAPQASNGPAADERSIYVGNVDYSSTPEQLEEHFSTCGAVNRVTILHNKYTGQPKGFAYIEFKEAESTAMAMTLNAQEFNGRPLKISLKRTNIHGYNRSRYSRRGSRYRRRRSSYGGYRPRYRRSRRASYYPY